MKIRSIGILIGMVFVGTCHAQGSVTLYGLLDSSIAYVSNQHSGSLASTGHSSWSMTSGALNSERWGLRGNEDLGDGLSAIFTLENGFSSPNGKLGTGGDEFGRQAYVGVTSDTYGTLTFGRQYDFILSFVTPLGASGPGWGGDLAMHADGADDSILNLRINNAVKYVSQSYRGLTVGVMYGFSNLAGQFSNNSAYSGGLSYANGPIQLGAAYLQVNRAAGAGSANPNGAISTSDGDATITGGSQKIWALGGRYTLGPGSVGLAWSHSSTDAVTGVAQGGSITPLDGNHLTFDNFTIDSRYFLTPAFSVAAAYTYTDGRFGTSTQTIRPKWDQEVLQADYAFGKRTDLYVEGVYQRVSGGNGNPAFNASIYSFAPSSNGNQFVVATGLRHRF